MSEGSRLLGTAGRKGCRFGCLYCFTQDPAFERCPLLDEDRPRKLISGTKKVDIVQPACDTELFLTGDWRDFLDNLASTGRIISFATKAIVGPKDIAFLKTINEILLSRGAVLHICVTIVRLRDWQVLEPKAPSPEERIQFLRTLWQEGIGTCVAVRPMMPFTEEDELEELVSRTHRFAYGYLSGPLYLTERMRKFLDDRQFRYEVETRRANWQKGQPERQVIQSSEREEQLTAFARSHGRAFFRNNKEAALYVRAQRARALPDRASWSPEIRREDVATIYIFDPNTREFMLVFHRNLGAWLAPGGHIELGEKPSEAALREAEEEVGLNPTILRIRGNLPSNGEHFRRVATPAGSQAFCTIEEFIRPLGGHDPHIHVDSIIVGIADSSNVAEKRDSSEVAAYGWFNLKEIENDIETFDNVPPICRAIIASVERHRNEKGAQRNGST